ncbi:kinase [Halobellus sp. Atlit-38R]|nr:kinase [Halobellus sp. Atlit-38R]
MCGREPIVTARLIVVTGLPGVGKTAVSREIVDRLGGRLIRTDVVRTDCFDDPEYTAAERETVYDEVFARGRETIANGGVAVLDGTFRTRADRARAVDLANAVGVPLDVVAVECADSVVEARIAARENDASEADIDIYRQFKERYEPIEIPHVRIDNSGDLASTREQIVAVL